MNFDYEQGGVKAATQHSPFPNVIIIKSSCFRKRGRMCYKKWTIIELTKCPVCFGPILTEYHDGQYAFLCLECRFEVW